MPKFLFYREQIHTHTHTPLGTILDSAEGWDMHPDLGAQRAPVLSSVCMHKIELNP